MERLTRYLKNVGLFPKNRINEFLSQLTALQLQPGEHVPSNIPENSWIFVENGLIATLRTEDGGPESASTFDFQGHSFYSSRQYVDEQTIIQWSYIAIEPSILFILSPDIIDNFPKYPNEPCNIGYVLYKMTHRVNFTLRHSYKVSNAGDNREQALKVLNDFPSFRRIPMHYLIPYMNITDDGIKQALYEFQNG